MTDIQEILRRIITSVLVAAPTSEALVDPPDLSGELQLDSLMALQIIVLIEQEFNIFIEDDAVAIDMLSSLEKATAYVEKACKEHVIFLAKPANS